MREPGGNLEHFSSAAHESDFGGDAVNIFLSPRVYIYTFFFFLSLSRRRFVSGGERDNCRYRYHDRLRARWTAVMKVFSAHVCTVFKGRRCLFQISRFTTSQVRNYKEYAINCCTWHPFLRNFIVSVLFYRFLKHVSSYYIISIKA